MAAEGLGREQPLNNQVAQDFIWRSHCEQETRVAKSYDLRYGFLRGPISKFAQDDLDEIIDKNRPDWRTMVQKPKNEHQNSFLNKILPSPQPVPQTTSGMIGWRCSNSDYWLERYGPYTKGKCDIYRQLKWPRNSNL
ncbi:hypothetical protein D915_006711 [Fasciola hepatica]|uniref:Uncharacterized protein n=1 Tax=Fasciola hepatica TaxID=6192 RepID=A0A2H1C6E2_FASHE|nr:hypothetical protein D915_006711 [Fasciola hepatica]